MVSAPHHVEKMGCDCVFLHNKTFVSAKAKLTESATAGLKFAYHVNKMVPILAIKVVLIIIGM